MAKQRTPRVFPSTWLLVLLFLLGCVVVWLQFTDGAGDGGMNNVFSYMAVLLGALAYGLWFLFGSGQSARLRFGSLAAVIVAIVAVVKLVDLEGWTGSMVPVVRWAWEEPEERAVAATESMPRAESVDLATRSAEDFPGFLGARRDGVLRGINLARDWSTTPPELLWRQEAGNGWSGFAVVNGVAVTHEESDGQEHVVARAAATGEELWRTSYEAAFDHALAGQGPHATPAIDDGFVYAQGATGKLLCLDGTDGSIVWQHDLLEMFEVTADVESATVQYGRSGSPLVHGDLLIMPAGGDPDGRQAGLVAFDKRSGELRWEGPPRAISHSSPNVATLGGVEQVVIVNESTVSGHALADGALLWEHEWPGTTAADANNSQATVVGEDGILVSKGYGLGSSLLRIAAADDGEWGVEVVWANRRSLRTKLTNPVLHGDHAYALSDGILECVGMEDGKRVWKEGRFGHGQLLLVGDLLLVLTEEGELVLVEASPAAEGEELARFSVLEGKTWNTFALYGDLAVVRNGQEAAAVRLPRADS